MKKIFLLLLALSFNYLAFGQVFYNSGAIVMISSNTIFSVGDSLVNNGILTNNGEMVVGGVWINTGTYNPGTGGITFNNPSGGKPQIINHNSQSFNKLTISGGGEKLILANLTVVGELNLVNGVIASQNNSKVIFLPGATITGGSDQSHIHGPVEQQGAGKWLFPLGTGSVYLPVEISDVPDDQARGTVQWHGLDNGETLTGERGIAQLSSKQYWELNGLSGSLGNAVITLPVKEEGFSALPGLFAVGQSGVPLGPYESLGQSGFIGTPGKGSVSSELPPTLSYFTVVVLSGEKNIVAYNGVSPNGDGYNDYFEISNIGHYPNNKVSIYNRWGDKVFEVTGYDNDQKVFKGENNITGNGKLSSGVYFYRILLGDGTKELNGYLELKAGPR